MLNFYVSLAYTIINVILALLIFLKSRRSLLSRFYLFCVGCLLCLGVTGSILNQPLGKELRGILENVTGFLFSFFPFLFLHFVVVFLRRHEILRSRRVIVGIYFVALFSYTTLLLGFIQKPVTATGGISQSGYIFYITWMSVFFTIGVALLYVIEDEETLLTLLKVLLEEKGYRVITARSGVEGVEVYSRQHEEIGLVFTDLGWPILSGWEAFQEMKQIDPAVKVIVASGYLDPNAKSELLKQGAKDFIQKPYEPGKILKKIREVLNHS